MGKPSAEVLGYPSNYTPINKCQPICNFWMKETNPHQTYPKQAFPLDFSILQDRIHPSPTQAGSALYIDHSSTRIDCLDDRATPLSGCPCRRFTSLPAPLGRRLDVCQ